MKTRSNLLAHYADCDPHSFVQIDGFAVADEIMGRDDDGHGVCGSMTTELMRGSDVRLLIPPNADPATVTTLLLKAAAWIEQGAIADIMGNGDPDIPF